MLTDSDSTLTQSEYSKSSFQLGGLAPIGSELSQRSEPISQGISTLIETIPKQGGAFVELSLDGTYTYVIIREDLFL